MFEKFNTIIFFFFFSSFNLLYADGKFCEHDLMGLSEVLINELTAPHPQFRIGFNKVSSKPTDNFFKTIKEEFSINYQDFPRFFT